VLIVLVDTKIPGRVPAALWISSPYNTLHHLLGPVLTSGALLPAVAWAAAAMVLPHAVTRRSLPLDAVRTIVWAGLLLSATAALGQSSMAPPMMLGALLGAVLMLAPTALAAYRGERLSARSVP
jgi:hypothetical protein